MGTLKKIQRAKCAGCTALKILKSGYSCKLGITVAYEFIGVVAIAPRPEEPCYKPVSEYEFKEAKKK